MFSRASSEGLDAPIDGGKDQFRRGVADLALAAIDQFDVGNGSSNHRVGISSGDILHDHISDDCSDGIHRPPWAPW